MSGKKPGKYIAWLLAIILCVNNLDVVSAAETGKEQTIEWMTETKTVSGADLLSETETVSGADLLSETETVSGTDIPENTDTVSGADEAVPAETVSDSDMMDETAANVEEVSDTISDNETAEESFFVEKVSLSAEQRRAKQELSLVAAELETLEAGEDYVEHEVVALADTVTEAQLVADCYQAEIIECEGGVAVLKVEPSVERVIATAASLENDYPVVYPNYIYSIAEFIESEEEVNDAGIENQWHHDTLDTENGWLQKGKVF